MKKEIEILIDIDGCLLSTNGNVSPDYYIGLNELSHYIKQANQGKFPKIGFCTGRDRNYVEAVAFFTGLPNSWSIIESGIALFNPTTKELVFNPALTTEIQEIFLVISENRIPQVLEKYPDLFLYPGNMINVALERRYGSTLSIEESYETVQKELNDLLRLEHIVIRHSDIAIDISPSCIDKASGVKFLSQYSGIDLQKTLGIGDTNGDFPMLELVGSVGCPSNASEECKKLVKSRGGYISPYKYASGVADIFQHFFGQEG